MSFGTFWDLIAESKHLKHTMKLQAIDNSARSRGDISFDEHLESLREDRERWQNFNWKWETSRNPSPSCPAFYSTPMSSPI